MLLSENWPKNLTVKYIIWNWKYIGEDLANVFTVKYTKSSKPSEPGFGEVPTLVKQRTSEDGGYWCYANQVAEIATRTTWNIGLFWHV